MRKKTILIIEDDADIRELLNYNLVKEGYKVLMADNGEQGLTIAQHKKPAIVLLDIMLPGMDGFEVCKALKKKAETELISIIMLTAKAEESDIVVGLELGAEDYISKPFSPKVVMARIRAALRRQEMQKQLNQTDQIDIHGLFIDAGKHEVRYKKLVMELTLTEFRLLQFLASRPGWVFTRYQIVDSIHGDDYPVTERSVDVQIVGLRKKMGAAGKFIETVRGVGYRFKE